MIKKFLVNNDMKKRALRLMIESDSKFSWLNSLKKLLLIITLVLPVLFLVYAYKVSNGFVWLHGLYAAQGSKNHLFIWTVCITMIVIFGLITFILKILFRGLAGRDIDEKIDESLMLDNGALVYGYRLKMQSYRSERVVATIPLNECTYSIDEKGKKITFFGNIFSQFYTDYNKNEINGKGNYIDKITLYDYFEPSLVTFLNEWRS